MVHVESEKLVLATQLRDRVCIGLSSISLVKNLWTQPFSHGELDWSFRLNLTRYIEYKSGLQLILIILIHFDNQFVKIPIVYSV